MKQVIHDSIPIYIFINPGFMNENTIPIPIPILFLHIIPVFTLNM